MAYRPSVLEHRDSSVLDCRHGRVLLNKTNSDHLIVWNPVTGAQYHLSKPNLTDCGIDYKAALLCARGMGCDHRNCTEGHFLVALVATRHPVTVDACLYTSENGTWSKFSSRKLNYERYIIPTRLPAAFVGASVFFLGDLNTVLQYNLEDPSISVIQLPPAVEQKQLREGLLIPTRNAGLGFATVKDKSLCIWYYQTGTNNQSASWVNHTVNLEEQLPGRSTVTLLGYSDVAHSILVSTGNEVFHINVSSFLVIKACDKKDAWRYQFPYLNFAFPGIYYLYISVWTHNTSLT